MLVDRGTCSFCGKDRRITRGLVGTADQPVCICDHCLELCCEVLAEKARHAYAPAEGHRGVIDEAALAEVRAALRARAPELPAPAFACSLCGDARALAIIHGPRVFICDACVAAAAGVLT